MLKFSEIEVGENFCIPSDNKMAWFRKLPFNKAVSLENGKVEHFPDITNIWLHEFTK